MPKDIRPICKLTNTDGNVFALAGRVKRALRTACQDDRAEEFSGRLLKCHSYEEALELMGTYVRIE